MASFLHFTRYFCVAAICLFSNSLFAIKGCMMSDQPFEIQHSIDILNSVIEVYEPGDPCPFEPISQAYPQYWCVRHCMLLSNGLIASNTMLYDDSSYQKLQPHYDCSGPVNIIPRYSKKTHYEFSLVFDDGGLMHVDLWAVNHDKQGDLPRIQTCKEQVTTIPGWFYNEKKFQYEIELSDGTQWITQSIDTSWAKPWALKSRIIRIGNDREVFLINRDSFPTKESYISIKHCLLVERKMTN